MTTDTAPRERKGLLGLVARHPVVSYFVIAFAGSWLAWSQFVLSADASGWFSFHATYGINPTIAIASLAGPTVAAVVVMYCTYGEPGLVDFFKRLVRWRVGVWWWVVALVGLSLAAAIGALLVPGVARSFDSGLLWPGITSFLPVFLYPALLAGGPLGEEIGWRGAGLPLLQNRLSPLGSSLILGPLWALWHAPIWFSNNWARPSALNILALIVWISAATVTYTWVFNNTQRQHPDRDRHAHVDGRLPERDPVPSAARVGRVHVVRCDEGLSGADHRFRARGDRADRRHSGPARPASE